MIAINKQVKHKPSKYQEAIYNAILYTDKNIVISATAGSGKSTTLIEAAKLVDPKKEILFTAFNRSIVQELSTKLPSHINCSTLHSLGMRAIMSHFRTQLRINEFKSFQFIEEIIKEKFKFKDGDKKAILQYKFAMRDAINLARMTMSDLNYESLFNLRSHYEINLDKDELLDVAKVIKRIEIYNRSLNKNYNQIDYVDMIHIPISNPKIKLPKFDYVFVDESQDNNACQHQFVLNLLAPKARTIYCGDEYQCQPKGTKILMSGLYEKNIEDLKIGDNVVSYERHTHCYFKGTNAAISNNPKIEKISSRKFIGDLIRITSNNKVSQYTPEHICMVRFRADKIKAHAVYIMEQSGRYRIGITPLWTKNSIGSVTLRAKQEKADKMWILDVYETRKEAYIVEQYYSCKFGIAQMIFHYNDQMKKYDYFSQSDIDKFYSLFDKEESMKKVKNLLLETKREFDYPFWVKGKKNYISKLHMFELEACNIIPQYMQVIHFNKKSRAGYRNGLLADYQNIDNLEYIPYNDLVYSLQVSKHQMYIADGILTHNCIYSFMGGDVDSFNRIQERPNTITLPLSQSFRCSKSVVQVAKQICSSIEPFEGNEEGEVRYGDIEEIQEGDMVLSRNNRPLFYLYFKLLYQEKNAVILGKDIEVGLQSLISKVKKKSTDDGVFYLQEKLSKLEEELKSRGVKKTKEHPTYTSLFDKVKTIEIISHRYETMKQVSEAIEEMFREKDNCIKLCTVHFSKGLECDTVFLIERFNGNKMMPSPYATMEWQKTQERNLMFVAITRSKRRLIFIQNINDND